MRTTALISLSLPPSLVKESEKIAKSKHMTRSELFRTALRHYLEEQQALVAISLYEKERDTKKLKTLKGSLASLMN